MPFDAFLAGSPATLLLAPVVGAYLCFSAVGLLNSDQANGFISDLRDHPASVHAVGAIAFFVGAMILSFHRHWMTPPEILINLVAVWWTFEGAGMLLDPARIRSLFTRPFAVKQMRLTSLVNIPLGTYLLLIGLFGRAA